MINPTGTAKARFATLQYSKFPQLDLHFLSTLQECMLYTNGYQIRKAPNALNMPAESTVISTATFLNPALLQLPETTMHIKQH